MYKVIIRTYMFGIDLVTKPTFETLEDAQAVADRVNGDVVPLEEVPEGAIEIPLKEKSGE